MATGPTGKSLQIVFCAIGASNLPRLAGLLLLLPNPPGVPGPSDNLDGPAIGPAGSI